MDQKEGNEKDENKTATTKDMQKCPKKKVAMILGYKGTGYQGMQTNTNAKTVEDTLFRALCEAGFVSADNAESQKKVSMMRACRTDKGVHAAMQVVSLKMILPQQDDHCREEWAERTNRFLPKDIRVFGVQRVSNSFQARTQCNSRVYEYLLPSYVLEACASDAPFLAALQAADPGSMPQPSVDLLLLSKSKRKGRDEEEEEEEEEEGASQSESDEDGPQQEANYRIAQPTEIELAHQSSFRCPPESLALLRETLQGFVGTHRFHHYTIGKSPHEPNAQRFIRSFQASEPYLATARCSGRVLEWVRLSVHGQSFMLHQIRKLVGMAILIVKTRTTPKRILPVTFAATTRCNIPKAPGLGLLLAESCFDGYNKKFPDRTPLSLTQYKDKIEAFKTAEIEPEIYDEESQFHRFFQWWAGLAQHAHDFYYLKK